MAINIFLMALMPISQCVAWYSVLFLNQFGASSSSSSMSSSESSAITSIYYTTICCISTFYCLWALYNRYLGGNVQELGQYTMGLLAICTYLHKYMLSIMASSLVLFNFFLPSYFILYKWNTTELARNVKNDTSSLAITWALIFKLYFVSNIFLWSTVVYKFYIMKPLITETSYTTLPTHH